MTNEPRQSATTAALISAAAPVTAAASVTASRRSLSTWIGLALSLLSRIEGLHCGNPGRHKAFCIRSLSTAFDFQCRLNRGIEFNVVLFRRIFLPADLARDACLVTIRSRDESFDVILGGHDLGRRCLCTIGNSRRFGRHALVV